MEKLLRFNAARLRELRTAKKLTRAQLATLALNAGVPKISEAAITNQEKGVSEPRGLAFAFYCEYFEVAINELYYDSMEEVKN